MKKIEIKNRVIDKIIISGKYESIKDCLEKNRGADLRDANLVGADLRGADLRDANLWGADLEDADLRDANLWGADLEDADLRDANLVGADLRGADLVDANLRDADLEDADLRDANLEDADLRGADLVGADLRDANLWGAYLRGADLRGAKNYSESHNFFAEIIKRQSIDYFTEKEWSIIGKVIIKRLCWDSIKKEFGKDLLRSLKKISTLGFDEYEKRFKEIIEEE